MPSKRDREIFDKVTKGLREQAPSKAELAKEAKRLVAQRKAEQAEAKRRKVRGQRHDDGDVFNTGMFDS